MDGNGNVIDVLTRIRAGRGAPQPAGERCEMCSEAIADEHQHVVNLEGRQLMCVCRGCYLLFTDTQAELRYRAVPDRYLAFQEFALDRRAWRHCRSPRAALLPQLDARPHGGVLPRPAGATELSWIFRRGTTSTPPIPANTIADDTEAPPVRVPDDETASPHAYLVPIDACTSSSAGCA